MKTSSKFYCLELHEMFCSSTTGKENPLLHLRGNAQRSHVADSCMKVKKQYKWNTLLRVPCNNGYAKA